VKIGDLVRHPGGSGEPPAIGIVVAKNEERDLYEVLELCGEYAGMKADASSYGEPWEVWEVISEISLTDRDHPDTLQG
jgi:hypothetical protein